MHNMNDGIFMNDSTFDLKRRIAETIVTTIFLFNLLLWVFMEVTPYFFESITITIESQIFLIRTQTLLQCDFCCVLKI